MGPAAFLQQADLPKTGPMRTFGSQAIGIYFTLVGRHLPGRVAARGERAGRRVLPGGVTSLVGDQGAAASPPRVDRHHQVGAADLRGDIRYETNFSNSFCVCEPKIGIPCEPFVNICGLSNC